MAEIASSVHEYLGISRTTIKDGTSPYIEAFIPEFVPMHCGCIPSDHCEKAAVIDPFTKTTQCCVVHHTEAVRATYLGGSNMTIPSVCVGERVKIINFSGTQLYYWLPLGRDPGLRRWERQRWFIMSQPESVHGGDYENVTDLNSYFLEMNSNPGEKEIHLHTSMKDGEPYTYDFYIWPEKNQVLLKDNIGNFFKLDTKEHFWHLENVDKSYVEIDKKNITLSCDDTITLKAGKHIVETAGETYKLTAPDQTIIGKDRRAKLEQSDSFETLNRNVKAQTYINNYAVANFQGGKITTTGEYSGVLTAHGQDGDIICCGSNSW